MTDLKKLLIEFDTLTQKNRGLSLSKQIDLLESTLSKKFSVTLRGDDSSADNVKHISDKINDLLNEQISKDEYVNPNFLSTISDAIESYYDVKITDEFIAYLSNMWSR